jgi:hypothetical protein
MELVTIEIRGLPVPLHGRSQEHSEGLMREFALMANPHPDSEQEPPQRLIRLMEQLRGEYSGFTAGVEQSLQDAIERGDEIIDLEYRLPVAVRGACIDLDQILDEVDEFCRAGEMLTLASPPELVRYRKWFLDEFVNQIDGKPPTPWSEYEA